MNRGLEFLANTFLMVASISGTSGKSILPKQTISIRLYDRAQVPAEVLHSATDEASRLFLRAGIRINWQCPSTEPPEDQGTDMSSPAFAQEDVRPYLVVRLIRRMPASVLPGALGYALPFAHKGAHAVIFYDRGERLAQSMNRVTPIVLGYAIAHEIGHVLLRSSDHAPSGLMQARWTPETWGLASSGLLAFTRGEGERMRAGFQRSRNPEVLAASATDEAKTAVELYLERNLSDRNLNLSWGQGIASQIFAGADAHVNGNCVSPGAADSTCR